MRSASLVIAVVIGLGVVCSPAAARQSAAGCSVTVAARDDAGRLFFEIGGSGFPPGRRVRVEAVNRATRRGQTAYVAAPDGAFAGLLLGKQDDGTYVALEPGAWRVRAKAGSRSATATFVVPERLRKGSWGAADAALKVDDSRATFEMACGGGEIAGPVYVDAGGKFDVQGAVVLGRRGPSAGARSPARFSGVVRGDTLTLTVTRADTGDVVGTYTLAFGVEFSDSCL